MYTYHLHPNPLTSSSHTLKLTNFIISLIPNYRKLKLSFRRYENLQHWHDKDDNLSIYTLESQITLTD